MFLKMFLWVPEVGGWQVGKMGEGAKGTHLQL